MREAMSVSARRAAPVVALVRDAHRHPWVRRGDCAGWAGCGPHLVMVEMGWPGERATARGGLSVRTYGAARANGEALDAVLSGAGPEAGDSSTSGSTMTSRRLGVAAALVDGSFVPGDVRLDGGVVAAVGLPPAAGGGLAVPGLVDLQVNGYAGVDFLTSSAEEWREAERGHGARRRHGVRRQPRSRPRPTP